MQVSWLARFWWLLRRALISLYEDGCIGIAKGAAYSALLSFFPVLMAVALILVHFKAQAVASVISRFLFEVVPPGTQQMVLRQFTVRGEKPESLMVLALLVSLWSASGLILSLIDGFNAVYKVPTNRPMVPARLVAFALEFGSVLPSLGAAALILSGSRTELWVVTRLGMIAQGQQLVGWVLLLGKIARYAIAFAAVASTMMGLYKYGPNRPQKWRDIWPGALVATVLWLGATLGFSWYVRNIAHYNLFYGSMGAVIALILWLDLLSLITLYGCAFNAERERLELAINHRG